MQHEYDIICMGRYMCPCASRLFCSLFAPWLSAMSYLGVPYAIFRISGAAHVSACEFYRTCSRIVSVFIKKHMPLKIQAWLALMVTCMYALAALG